MRHKVVNCVMQSKLQVCLATTTFPRWAGDGEGAFVWGLAQALHRQGVVVRVLALHVPNASHHEKIDGIEVIRPQYWWPAQRECLRRDGGGLPINLRSYWLARVQLAPFTLIQGTQLARLAATSHLIHAHWTLSGALGLLGRWLHRRPVVITIQGSDIFQVPHYPLGRRATRATLQKCDRVTALTQSLKDAAVATGVAADHIDVIPNGVHVADFAPPCITNEGQSQRAKLILFVGSLITRKGVNHLLDALPQVFAKYPQHRAVVIGNGPEEGTLRQQADRLGLASRVDFLGFRPQAEIQEWMQRAQVFVLPSLEEGQGVVLLEALASGTPVVASAVDGIREVVTPECGILVPAANSAALAEALCRLLRDDARWQQMSSRARRHMIESYDWDRIAQRYITLYESVLT